MITFTAHTTPLQKRPLILAYEGAQLVGYISERFNEWWVSSWRDPGTPDAGPFADVDTARAAFILLHESGH